MHITSSCIILFMMILNSLCQGLLEENNKWDINFTPAEVTAVPGVCVVISCTFTNPNKEKPENLQLYQCKETNQCNEVTKFMKFGQDKNKCSININNISAENEGEYEIRKKGPPSHTYRPRFKIIIQDKPVISNHSIIEGQEANLICSAPAPCPKTPPDITWWIKQNEKSIKLKKITFTNSQGFYVATLTIMPTAELHKATIECEATYGKKILASRTIEMELNEFKTIPTASTKGKAKDNNTHLTVNPTQDATGNKTENEVKTNATVSPKDTDNGKHGNLNMSDTSLKKTTTNNTGVSNLEDFFQSLGLSRVHTFLVGIAISAVFFSVVLCCWVSCNRSKKPEVLAVPPDSAVHLEAVQTNIDSAVNDEQTNEETPLQNQFDVEMSSAQVELTGPAEENEAGGADANVDYAAIDYSLLKKKSPEEKEEETANTDYAEIKKDKKGRTTPQNQDEQVEISNEGSENQKQNEGEEGLYSNSQELESLAEYPKFP